MNVSDLPKQLSALVPFNRHVGVEVRDAEIAFLRPARGTVAAVATARETRSAIDARLERDGRAETGVDVSLTADGVEVARVHVRWYLRRR